LISSFKSFFKKIIAQNTHINNLLPLFADWLLVLFRLPKLEKSESDQFVINIVKEKSLLNTNIFLLLFDYIYLYVFSLFCYFGGFKKTSLPEDKIQQLDNVSFYRFNNKITLLSTQQLFLFGLRSI